MKNNNPIDRKRNAAGSISLPDPSDPIQDMIELDDILYIIRDRSVYEIKLADTLDPQRKHISTKGTTCKVLDIGMNSTIVSRILTQARSLIRNACLSKECDKTITKTCFNCVKELKHLDSIYNDLSEKFSNKKEKYNEILARNPQRDFIQDVPIIENIDKNARDFFVTGHKYLQLLLDLANLAIPNNDSKKSFSEIKKYYLTNNDQDNKILLVLQHYDNLLDFMWNLRNSIEHSSTKGNLFAIINISYGEKNEIIPPMWEYSFNSWSKTVVRTESKRMLLDDMRTYIENLLKITEDLLVSIICTIIDSRENFFPYKISIDEDPRAEIRYKLQFFLPNDFVKK
ncbi:MAG: hypothetical protein VB017_00070 [Endomicrobiaceae bacterium]|nr:hypothetical protein [Endomicrobiaceae bacterium]